MKLPNYLFVVLTLWNKSTQTATKIYLEEYLNPVTT